MMSPFLSILSSWQHIRTLIYLIGVPATFALATSPVVWICKVETWIFQIFLNLRSKRVVAVFTFSKSDLLQRLDVFVFLKPREIIFILTRLDRSRNHLIKIVFPKPDWIHIFQTFLLPFLLTLSTLRFDSKNPKIHLQKPIDILKMVKVRSLKKLDIFSVISNHHTTF